MAPFVSTKSSYLSLKLTRLEWTRVNEENEHLFWCLTAQTLPQPHFTDTGQLHAVYFLNSHKHGLIVDIYPVQMVTIMGFNHGMQVPVVSVLVVNK